MTQQTTSTGALPTGMALIETAEGRWFPAFASLTDTPHWVTFLDIETSAIPPALPVQSCADQEQGYPSRQQALDACCAWDEAIRLSVEWERLAASTEVYPERNAWYREEIAQMLGGSHVLVLTTLEAMAAVVIKHPGIQVISARGITPDEALECLYEQVYACALLQEQAS
ncbi:MAG TPA: hypothetical protein VFA09_03080 [Ktedonobacteraceae bacterium]|nr:hypothetical protein [Ktedonobacteraceae bacterium]HZU66238.1 hypothetical protein [Ktedonobacteraceae bacterium]